MSNRWGPVMDEFLRVLGLSKPKPTPEYDRRLDLFLQPWCLSCRTKAGIPTPDWQWYQDGVCGHCGLTLGIPILDEHDFRKEMYEAFEENE